MTKGNYQYNWKALLVGALIWESIFWSTTFVCLYLVGFLDPLKSAGNFSFKTPTNFWLILCLIPLTCLYFYGIWKRNNQTKNIQSSALQTILMPISSMHSFLRYFFYRNTLILLIFAMAQPVWGKQKLKAKTTNNELVICIDVSNSMNTRDIDKQISRLDISKRAVNQFINQLKGEKIGIAVFAGAAYVQLPLTTDYAAAKLFVNEITTDMVSAQGTNISAALRIADAMFTLSSDASKSILLITDGENHEENPTDELMRLKDKNIQVNVLGIGTKLGGPVPRDGDRPEMGYKTDGKGKIILSKVNPKLIQAIAQQANGFATISDNPFPDLNGLLTEINQIKHNSDAEIEIEVMENHYQIPLFAALVFWILFLSLNAGIINRFQW